MQILKIGQVFTIRWVSSSFNTVKAVLKDFPVLAHHFQSASEDGSRSGAEKANEFRDWKLQGKEHQGKTLKRLIVASNTVLPTSSECERGFSACNNTDCKTRNRLRARSLNALLFVDLNGPPINKFDPFPFIQSWINKGHRTSTSWVPGPRPQPAENRPLWAILSA
ncbi:Zinc finger protein 862 [Dissostichus eleginoides]|uniref:Zinc finger protein 862 n=1 Tax=Dissostichus eleginoides TaxID=100907 RepID=A0AAD9C784_DISEL|nr:Zinc finger protein 862 [Dissostichus eleginoides]